MRVAVIGCGLIGQRRGNILRSSAGDSLVMVSDIDRARAKEVATEMQCRTVDTWRDVVAAKDIDAVIVSTPNKFLKPIVVAALDQGKHVLCEKPMGRNADEAQEMADASRRNDRILKIGFNHRHHPAIARAHQLCSEGEIGAIMFIRAVYGHGGRAGYDKEWRGSADLAGGGELLDQGVHIVDLCRWFLGEFEQARAMIGTYFWNLGYFDTSAAACVPARLEDNAFVMLRTADAQVAQFQTSWTQWKNRFSFEVFGSDGFVSVEGLGGSYGTERLTIGRRRPESGPPEEETYEYPGADISWQAEWDEFSTAVREGRQPLANGEDGLRTMRLIEKIYQSACAPNLQAAQ